MKLIVNIGVLRHPLTGVGRYVLNLLERINQHPDVEDLVGVTLTGFLQRDQLQLLLERLDTEVSGNQNFKRKFMNWASRQNWARALQNQWIRLKVLQFRGRYKSYIYWETSGALLPFQGPVVSTVFDLSFLALPDYHPSTRVHELQHRIPAYLQRSSRVLTISQFTKAQLEQHYSVTVPVDVIYPAVADDYFAIDDMQKQLVKSRLSLPDNYLLAVSTLEPRKNLGRLLQAYDLLPQHLKDRFPLLLAGAKGWKLDSLSTGAVRYLGYVNQADLPAVVALASLNVYLSLYEGYGMPIAESMAAGTPMLCSNLTSMPEVANNCCFLVDPTNMEDIVQTMKTLLESESIRNSKLDAARHVASSYTWNASADKMIKAMKLIQP